MGRTVGVRTFVSSGMSALRMSSHVQEVSTSLTSVRQLMKNSNKYIPNSID